MGGHGQTTTEPLHSPHLPHQKASITVRAEQAKNSSDLVVFALGTTNCPRGHKRWVPAATDVLLFLVVVVVCLMFFLWASRDGRSGGDIGDDVSTCRLYNCLHVSRHVRA